MLKSINALFLTTKNMNVMVDFYQRLGLPLKVSDHGGGLHAECEMGEVHFALHPPREGTPTQSRFSFHVPNLEEYCAELKDKGLVFMKDPAPHPFGGVIAELHDPDGNQVILTRWQSQEEYARNFPTQTKE